MTLNYLSDFFSDLHGTAPCSSHLVFGVVAQTLGQLKLSQGIWILQSVMLYKINIHSNLQSGSRLPKLIIQGSLD